MIPRIASARLMELAALFKAVAVVGPRQSGKTTLVKSVFPDKPYVSLENPDIRLFASDDPRGFLKKYSAGAVLDEIQRVPHIFSYLQEILDNSNERGKYILTGSNNFLMQENISQSLAGRVAYLQLLPFSLEELFFENISTETNRIIFNGFYPPPFDQKIPVTDWMPNYIRTYIERDVRQIKNINDLLVFEKFMRLLAGNAARELNYSSLSVNVGVDIKTLQSWVGILESSFIIYLLRPHHRNFNKMIVKRPKLFFYDSGLVCSLLEITSLEHLANHPLLGQLFENMVVSELVKFRTHRGRDVNYFYWRDKTGHEVDIIVENTDRLIPVEIKTSATFHPDFLKNLHFWMKLSGEQSGILLYNGELELTRSDGIHLMNWKNMSWLSDTSS